MKKSRRGVLKSASTLGFASAFLVGADSAVAKGNGNKKIEGVRFHEHTNHTSVKKGEGAPSRKPVKYSLPFAKWKHINVRKYIAKELIKDFDDPELAAGIGVIERENGFEVEPIALYCTIEHANGDTSSPEITYEEFVEMVPNKMTGIAKHNGKKYREEDIPIRTHNRRNVEEAFNDRYRPVPGGCAHGNGTLGTPVVDGYSGDQAWVTAAHTVDRSSGYDVYQPSSSFWYDNKIGESDRYTFIDNGDAAVISAERDIWYGIAGSNGSYDYPIYGKVASSNIEDQNILWKQGKTTGRDYGSVKEVYWHSSGHERVNLDVYTDSGDSGGPYYARNEDRAYIAGIHNGSSYDRETGERLHAYGQTMEDVEDKLDVTV